MYNSTICYENGEEIEKKLEKAFYWQKVAESNKVDSEDEVELCNECKQPYIDYKWCQQCNTKRFQQDTTKLASKNEFIDKFIQEAQQNARNSYEILEWIPYDRLSNIEYYDKGGFSEIHKAIWLDGPIYSWNFNKQQWNRQTGYEVILKIIGNSSSLDSKFLNEWKYHYNYDYNEVFVIDLGLCKPINDSQNSDIYGVVPYMAPEILRSNPYTSASDIYSFSMIMWEFTSGSPPYKYKAHDYHLILSICEGERPEIIENTPKCYIDLMKKCWDLDPSNRPTITMLENIISEWIRCINEYYKINRSEIYMFEVSNINSQLKDNMLEFVKANEVQKQVKNSTTIIQSHSQAHSQAHYTSRKLSKILSDSEGLDCMI
ncbi:kinase-like domain-containing protein [Rhizophagus clarus]|uniref:Kinase-like domain-containing protein n=1 Tax=Rhizophagus clarus TaxID=94130 RepID=A0A8H3L0Z1_9GLOM|nr:kinase-like domain-containing protein [Rhizophagus clarus]